MTDKKLAKKPAASSYDAESITVLEGLEPVRKRPGMYIGSTSASGLHHLIWEVVDNGIDEAMAGHATLIKVALLDNGMVEVSDNGRGIPVGIHKVTKVSALETVLTKLHAGGKFGDGGGYKVSGGLHGVGVSVVNALSEYLKAEVHREGKVWLQEYERGKPLKKVKPIGNSKKTGTIITFKPDSQILEETEFNWGTILDRLRQQAYLTKGITIEVADRRKNHRQKNYKFYFEGGIKAYVKSLNRNNQVKNETIFYIDKEVNNTRVEVALQYNDGFNETVLAFANNIINAEGGTHVVGFRTALTRTLNSYARTQNLIKEKEVIKLLNEAIQSHSADFRNSYPQSLLRNWKATIKLYNQGSGKIFQLILSKLKHAYSNTTISDLTLKQKAKSPFGQNQDQKLSFASAFKKVAINRPSGAPVRNDHKLGRNDPCWCGNGKKYKKCHYPN